MILFPKRHLMNSLKHQTTHLLHFLLQALMLKAFGKDLLRTLLVAVIYLLKNLLAKEAVHQKVLAMLVLLLALQSIRLSRTYLMDQYREPGDNICFEPFHRQVPHKYHLYGARLKDKLDSLSILHHKLLKLIQNFLGP